jgi:hypothetical protein
VEDGIWNQKSRPHVARLARPRAAVGNLQTALVFRIRTNPVAQEPGNKRSTAVLGFQPLGSGIAFGAYG